VSGTFLQVLQVIVRAKGDHAALLDHEQAKKIPRGSGQEQRKVEVEAGIDPLKSMQTAGNEYSSTADETGVAAGPSQRTS
jgi:hypothetical protein